jgi:hypothetical protein
MKGAWGVLALATALALGSQASATADVINGGFETGTFGDVPGWDGIGDFGSVGPDLDGLGIGPTEGSRLGFIDTFDVFGAVPVADIEAFLGLQAGTFAAFGIDAQNGSALQQSVVLNPGDTVSFDFNFATSETGDPAFDDLAIFAVLSDADGSGSLFLLADVFSAPIPTNVPDVFQTGWISASLPADAIFSFSPGSYRLGFAVMNVGDIGFDSYLFLDNVRVTPVPEPGSLLGLAIGGLGLAVVQVARARRQVKLPSA